MSFASRLLGEKTAIEEAPVKKKEGQLAVDVFETAEDLVIIAPIAGVSIEGIQLTVQEDILTIKGERTQPEEVLEDAYYSKECFWGGFSRSIILPTQVDTDTIRASFKDGILKVRVAKMSSIAQKTINITLE